MHVVVEGKLYTLSAKITNPSLRKHYSSSYYSCIGEEDLKIFFKKEKMNESIPSDMLLDLAKS